MARCSYSARWVRAAEVGGDAVSAPVPPGGVTQSETSDGTLAVARDAIARWWTGTAAMGEKMPIAREAPRWRRIEVEREALVRA